MSDQSVGVDNIPAGAGVANVDTSELIVNSQTVERQRINISDPTDPVGIQKVAAAASIAESDHASAVHDATTGLTTDVAVTGDNAGTISAKLRGLIKIITDVWDNTNHRLNVFLENSSIAVTGTFWQATQPVSIADGLDVAAGATTDAAVTGDNAGTLSAKLRGLLKIFTDVWDNTNHRLNVFLENTSLAVTGTFWQATQPVSEADGANVALGLTTDQGVMTDADGTVNAHIRGLIRLAGDRGSNPTALNGMDVAITLSLSGHGSAGFTLETGTLAGTLVPELSFDGGSVWSATIFIDPTTGGAVTNIVTTNPNSTYAYGIRVVGGVTHVRVRVSAFTGGTANGVVSVTQAATLPARGQSTMANSEPVVIASDQSILPTSTADGGNVAIGATSDVAVTGDNAGTLSAKLRGLLKIFTDVWDNTNHRLNVYLQNTSVAVTGTFWQATQPVSVADGQDAAQGTTTDVAVVGDTNGTLSAKLRGLSKILNDVWVSGSHWLQVQAMAGENHVGAVGGATVTVDSSFARPANTTAYAVGQLVANSTTAGSVTPLSWSLARVSAGSFAVVRARLLKTGTGTTNALFRVHLYSASPTVSNGDGAAWLSNGFVNYLGSYDITTDRAFSDGAGGVSDPSTVLIKLASGQTIYGLVEARGAYTPTSGETIHVILEASQD